MVDMSNEIAAGAGFKIQVHPLAFPALIPSLQTDEIDTMNAAVTTSGRLDRMLAKWGLE